MVVVRCLTHEICQLTQVKQWKHSHSLAFMEMWVFKTKCNRSFNGIISERRSKLCFSVLPFGLQIPPSGSHPFLNKSIHWFLCRLESPRKEEASL